MCGGGRGHAGIGVGGCVCSPCACMLCVRMCTCYCYRLSCFHQHFQMSTFSSHLPSAVHPTMHALQPQSVCHDQFWRTAVCNWAIASRLNLCTINTLLSYVWVFCKEITSLAYLRSTSCLHVVMTSLVGTYNCHACGSRARTPL